MPIEPPIILVGDGQVEMFQNADSVARNVEAIDAQLYKAYDVKGRPIRISGKFKTSGGWLGISLVTEDGPVTVSLQSLVNERPQHHLKAHRALEFAHRLSGKDPSPVYDPLGNHEQDLGLVLEHHYLRVLPACSVASTISGLVVST